MSIHWQEEPGMRVYAFKSCKQNIINFYGFGTYLGDFNPPDFEDFPGYTNPKIQLDNGHIVWGCECWWGPEEEFKKFAEGKEIIVVEPEDDRTGYAQLD